MGFQLLIFLFLFSFFGGKDMHPQPQQQSTKLENKLNKIIENGSLLGSVRVIGGRTVKYRYDVSTPMASGREAREARTQWRGGRKRQDKFRLENPDRWSEEDADKISGEGSKRWW
jgi:hypothetical protein